MNNFKFDVQIGDDCNMMFGIYDYSTHGYTGAFTVKMDDMPADVRALYAKYKLLSD